MLSLRAAEDTFDRVDSFPTKTPRTTKTNNNLLRTLKKENAFGQGPLTNGRPGKSLYPSTPAPKTLRLESNDANGTDGLSMKPSLLFTSMRHGPLGDKTNQTPFLLRRNVPMTPGPAGKVQLGASPILEVGPSILRPSSTRKSIRMPRKSFETPAPQGRRPHWDVSDGDISIEMDEGSVREEEANTILEEDDDDVEYMPPPAQELPWDPGFDMPDGKTLGTAIMEMARYPHLLDPWDFNWDNVVERAEVLSEVSLRTPRVNSHPFFDEEDMGPSPLSGRLPVAKPPTRTTVTEMPSASRPATATGHPLKTAPTPIPSKRPVPTASRTKPAIQSTSKSGPMVIARRAVQPQQPTGSTPITRRPAQPTSRSTAQPMTSVRPSPLLLGAGNSNLLALDDDFRF